MQRTGGAAARWREEVLHRFLVLSIVITTAGCGRSAPVPDAGDGTPRITLRPAVSRVQPAFIEVTGLTAQDLAGLRDARLGDAEWQSLLKITVGGEADESIPPVEGRYAVAGSAVTFTPLFPFDPGRPYGVTFDPARLPRPRQAAVSTTVVSLPALASEPTTVVTAVHPRAELWPENVLRMYIEFSAPMGNGDGRDFVKIFGDNGREVAIPYLPVAADFWSPDHTRYTIFFDPGRVKSGILPNRQLGRPLRAGHKYVLTVSPRWQDAQGQPLKADYRREFRVGPADTSPITLSDWRLASPAAGTRDALVVTFPRPLDHGILARALGVETRDKHVVEGVIDLEADDTRWVFTPAGPWQAGNYALVALSILEDPEGNQIGRAFEAEADDSKDPAPDAFRVAFAVAASRR